MVQASPTARQTYVFADACIVVNMSDRASIQGIVEQGRVSCLCIDGGKKDNNYGKTII
jgi:hypothetical protein